MHKTNMSLNVTQGGFQLEMAGNTGEKTKIVESPANRESRAPACADSSTYL